MVFVLPHDEGSISASGLHAVVVVAAAAVVRGALVRGLWLPFLDLDSFGPKVHLEAVTDNIHINVKWIKIAVI